MKFAQKRYLYARGIIIIHGKISINKIKKTDPHYHNEGQ